MRVVLGMVLIIFFLLVLLKLDFGRIQMPFAWVRPGLPLLSNLAGPVQHFKAAILDGWRDKVSVDLCGRKGFVVGLCLMSMAPSSFFSCSRER